MRLRAYLNHRKQREHLLRSPSIPHRSHILHTVQYTVMVQAHLQWKQPLSCRTLPQILLMFSPERQLWKPSVRWQRKYILRPVPSG